MTEMRRHLRDFTKGGELDKNNSRVWKQTSHFIFQIFGSFVSPDPKYKKICENNLKNIFKQKKEQETKSIKYPGTHSIRNTRMGIWSLHKSRKPNNLVVGI